MPTTLSVTPTRQFDGLVVAEIKPSQLASLRILLAELGQQTTERMQQRRPLESLELPFEKLLGVHYARLVLIDRDPNQPKTSVRPLLVFCTNFDGPEGQPDVERERALELHLEELTRELTPGLSRVFSHCEGFRAGSLHEFLRRHQLRSATYYVGASGRSRGQIVWEAELRRKIERILEAGGFERDAAEVVREKVLTRLAREYPEYTAPDGSLRLPEFPAQQDNEPKLESYLRCAIAAGVAAFLLLSAVVAALAPMPEAFLQPNAVSLSWRALTALGVTAVGLLTFAGLLYARFRYLEHTDLQFQPENSRATHDAFRIASADENYFLQNQLTHLVHVKAGPLRFLLIRVVFLVLKLQARLRYNKGTLGNIPSIHFARWVLLSGGRVLFISNFDSSWQSYLGDFIDQQSAGLTAVWSNTKLYPRTENLLTAGSRDASRFLAWTRYHQLPTQVWYAAYPGLSVVNVNANTEIRRGLAPFGRREIDAATWLFRLRGVDRASADHLFGEREPPLSAETIQGIVLHGYGHMPEARYLMFRVPQPPPAGLFDWLSKLELTSARDGSRAEEGQLTSGHLVNIAFTHAGLRALGIDEALCSRFATPFVQGSHDEYRARVNGDVGPSAPATWQWGAPSNEVHVLLLVYAKDKTRLARFVEHYTAQTRGLLEPVVALEGTTLPGRKEHFGFRDGIAQPTVQGSGRAELPDNTIAAGEVLLGHRDGYGNVASSPMSAAGFAFGHNGSYLVFRQLEQDVPAFWRFCAAQQGVVAAVRVASKLVGRWPSGAPLVRHPDRDPEAVRFQDQDDFTYLAPDQDNDRYGARCPFGAHIRRVNPRDWQLGGTREESFEITKLHRIIRRGRPYGEPLHPTLAAPALVAAAHDADGAARSAASLGAPWPVAERGLHFLAFNASLDRQFEFIQQQWANNPKFAGLSADPDALLGLSREPSELGLDAPGFTIQSDAKTGVVPRCPGLTSFVRVRGSAYFFMPSLPAVRLLGERLGYGLDGERFEAPPADEQLHIDSLIDSLKAKLRASYSATPTRRDAHPKMHGCVRARLVVEPNLPPELRVGVFREPRAYDAWLRFSNANGDMQADEKPDLRGAAIKLMGVPGSKLLDGEEHCATHDFLFVSHDRFIARDVAEFAGLARAIADDAVPRYFLTRWASALRYLKAIARHSNPLEITYFSMVPYLFGQATAKYQLRPAQPTKTPVPKDPNYNYLREALKAQLARGPARFDFMVQVRPAPRKRDIEDATVAWTESATPFRKLASLEIAQQDFDTPSRQVFAENLSFNPWRCLPDHRPLGGISRARRQVYRALSAFRHDRNAAPRVEPTPEDEA